MEALNLRHPSEIYDVLKSKISDISVKLENLPSQNDGHEPNVQHKSNKEILAAQQQNIEQAINDLEKNAEWKQFTIALFGETNAGKSTIIETLRILLNEETKCEQQKKFKEIQSNLSIREEDFYKLKSDLEHIEYVLEDIAIKKNRIESNFNQENGLLVQHELEEKKRTEEKIKEISYQFDSLIEKLNQDYQSSEKTIVYKKAMMSWWLKIIYIFKRLEEEKQIVQIGHELDKITDKKNYKIDALKREQKENILPIEEKKKKLLLAKVKEEEELDKELIHLRKEHNKLLNLQYEFDGKLSQLEPFKDGAIVGDGRSDFTRDSVEFSFNLGSQPVKIIDVPGIEGDENKVIDQISKAVKRSHAVFYVTNKDAPPNEGTLEKIKQHLGDQTEVWSIFNKPVTSPRHLKGELIRNEDERKALNALNKKMQDILNKAYQKDIVIAGLPALFSISTCLIPFSQQFLNQKKFLEKHNRADLLELSRLKIFQDTLKNDVVGNVDFKIKKSNFNKANYILIGANGKLEQIHDMYSLLEEDIVKQIADAKYQIDRSVLGLKQALRNHVERIIGDFKAKTRNATYEKIDSNIKNDVFKIFFEAKIGSNLEILQKEMSYSFEKELKDFECEIQKITQKLMKNLEELFDGYKDILDRNGVDFNLNFDDMKSGFSSIGLVTTGISAVILGLTQIWNPAGWAILAMAISGLVISFAKAVWSAFSSDFRKSEQRKNVDNNLAKISQDISKKAMDSLNDVTRNLEQKTFQIKQNLDTPSKEMSKFNQDLHKTIQEFSKLSQAIESQYGA